MEGRDLQFDCVEERDMAARGIATAACVEWARLGRTPPAVLVAAAQASTSADAAAVGLSRVNPMLSNPLSPDGPIYEPDPDAVPTITRHFV